MRDFYNHVFQIKSYMNAYCIFHVIGSWLIDTIETKGLQMLPFADKTPLSIYLTKRVVKYSYRYVTVGDLNIYK